LFLLVLLMASPSWAAPKKPMDIAGHPADNCAPIGRTEDGKLVYSMKCETLRAPPPRAESSAAPAAAEQAPAEPQTVRTGIFGMSFERKPAGGDQVPVNRPETR